MSPEPQIVLIDLSNLCHRTFHAVSPLSVELKGRTVHTHMTKGVLMSLGSLHVRWPAALFVICVEREVPTFRSKIWNGYKAERRAKAAERKKNPSAKDLAKGNYRDQHDLTIKVLESLGYPCLYHDGIEADDVIGILSTMCTKMKLHTIISSNDNDDFQLLNKYVRIHLPHNNSILTHRDLPGSIKPNYWHVVMALTGDKDEVPGTPKFGPVAAYKLIAAAQSDSINVLRETVKNSEKLINKTQAAVLASKEGRKLYELSLRLAKIIRSGNEMLDEAPSIKKSKIKEWESTLKIDSKIVPRQTDKSLRLLTSIKLRYVEPSRKSLF